MQVRLLFHTLHFFMLIHYGTVSERRRAGKWVEKKEQQREERREPLKIRFVRFPLVIMLTTLTYFFIIFLKASVEE